MCSDGYQLTGFVAQTGYYGVCQERIGNYCYSTTRTCELISIGHCAATEGNICTRCYPGYVLINGACQSCPPGCEICTSSSIPISTFQQGNATIVPLKNTILPPVKLVMQLDAKNALMVMNS